MAIFQKSKALNISQNTNSISDKIRISELLPNPKSTDKGNEWIEILNMDSQEINLQNWAISINKKTVIINETILIQPNSVILIDQSELTFTLPNGQSSLELLDPNGKQIDHLEYSSAPSQKSFALIQNIDNENYEWIWSNNTTPNEENPSFKILSGLIENIDLEKQLVEINNENRESVPVFMDIESNSSTLKLMQEGDFLKVKALVSNNSYTSLEILDHEPQKQLNDISTKKTTKEKQSAKTGLLVIISLTLSIYTLSKIKQKAKREIIRLKTKRRIAKQLRKKNQKLGT